MKTKTLVFAAVLTALSTAGAQAQTAATDSLKAAIQKEKEHLDGLSDSLKALTGDVSVLKYVKVTGFVQFRYEYNDTSKTGITGGYDPTKNLNANNFYVRRGRIKFSIQPGSSSKYVLQFDASKNTFTLKDAYVELYKTVNNHNLTFTAGQFNIPFGYEIEYSDTRNDFPERSTAENNLFKNERDRGINLTYSPPNWLQFNVGLLQGYGIDNTTFPWYSPTKLKHVVGRVKVKLGALDFGISGYHGTTVVPGAAAVAGSSTWYDANHNGAIDPGEVTTVDPRPATPSVTYDKNRLGADAQLYLNILPIGSTGVRAEYYGARDFAKIERGFYLWLSQTIYKKFAAAARYDYWDPNTASNSQNDATGNLGLAVHYFWDNNVRLSAAYEIPRTLKGNSYFASLPGYRHANKFTLQFQFGI